MSQKLPHIHLPLGDPEEEEGQVGATLVSLVDTGAGLNLGNLEYHKSVAERHPKLVSQFAYLKDMEDMETFSISGVGGGKEGEEDRGGIDVTAVITYNTPFVVNGQQVTVSFALGEGVACNTIFSCPFL